MYSKVPILVPVCFKSLSFEAYFANPKSASLGLPLEISIFCGLMSLCRMLWS